jgi:hypothetical protein
MPSPYDTYRPRMPGQSRPMALRNLKALSLGATGSHLSQGASIDVAGDSPTILRTSSARWVKIGGTCSLDGLTARIYARQPVLCSATAAAMNGETGHEVLKHLRPGSALPGREMPGQGV